jgi:hypothetical protein
VGCNTKGAWIPITPIIQKWVMSTSQIIIETLKYLCIGLAALSVGFFAGRYRQRRWPNK